MKKTYKSATQEGLLKEIERLRKYVPIENRYPLVVTPDIIQSEVSHYFDIDKKYMLEYTNKQKYVEPRQIAIYLCHTMAGVQNKSELARLFRRNHASIINTINRVTASLVSDPKIAKQIEEIGSRCIDVADRDRRDVG